jgi:hypothetical protein
MFGVFFMEFIRIGSSDRTGKGKALGFEFLTGKGGIEEHEYVEIPVATHPRVPGYGTHDHSLRLPAFGYGCKQSLGQAADMVALLPGRPEGGEHFFFKAKALHHATSSRSS